MPNQRLVRRANRTAGIYGFRSLLNHDDSACRSWIRATYRMRERTI